MSGNIPKLVFTQNGHEKMRILSKVFSRLVNLSDDLQSLDINQKPVGKRTQSNPPLDYVFTAEYLLEKLNLPELTETLVGIWDQIQKTENNNEAYIATELQQNMHGHFDTWQEFLEYSDIEDLIEEGWIEVEENILGDFIDAMNQEKNDLIKKHVLYLEKVTYEMAKEEESFLYKFWSLLHNRGETINQNVTQEMINELGVNLIDFNRAAQRLHTSLHQIHNELTN